MAISVVSKQYGDDTTTPVSSASSSDVASSPISEASNTTVLVNDTKNISDTTNNQGLPQENNDNGWLNELHPEKVSDPIQENNVQDVSEPIIPNMYIKADIETSHIPSEVAIFSEQSTEKPDTGFDMDDLLGNEPQETSHVSETTVSSAESVQVVADKKPTTDLFAQTTQEDPKKTTIAADKKSMPSIAPKKSVIKSLTMAAAGLFGVVVLGFVVMTMFPAGIEGTPAQDILDDTTISQEVVQEPVEEHTAAEEKTPQELAREELVNYGLLGEEYYMLGRDLKDRNMVRYALYVEKKSKDLIDMLDLDPNMDTKDIVVYFAQFDDYLQILEDWKATLGDNIPASGSAAIIEEDMFQQESIPFNDTSTNTLDDENTGSTQSGTTLSEPEQSELSDG